MTTPPPLMRDQRKIDADQLKLLSVFHFILAGLSIVGLGFLFLHWFLMHSLFENPEIWKNQKGGPPPMEFFAIFKWIYLFFGAMIVALGVANLISAFCLRGRVGRTLSIVVAALDCLGFPFGTVLGVFTIVVLLRDSVVELYEFKERTAAGPP